MIRPPQSAAATATFQDDYDVLAGYSARYSQPFPVVLVSSDLWDFSGVAGRPVQTKARQYRIDWRAISNPAWRRVAKQAAAALLHPEHPSVDLLASRRLRPLPLGSVYPLLTFWRRWFEWLTEAGVSRLQDVDQHHCDAYLARRRQDLAPGSRAGQVILPLRVFADYAPVLSESYRPGFRPWAQTPAAVVAGVKYTRENKTPWIPDDVLDPLLGAALFWVEVASKDVLAARAEVQGLAEKRRTESAKAIPNLLERHLEVLRAAARPLPLARDAPSDADVLDRLNLRLLGQYAGCALRRSSLRPDTRRLLREAADELGVAHGGLLTPISPWSCGAAVSGKPWREPIAPWEVQFMTGRLMAACYIVIAAISGMRPGEILELRAGCAHREPTTGGQSRWRLTSRIIKGKEHAGVEDRWTVHELVATAVGILEALQPNEPGALLFARSARTPHAQSADSMAAFNVGSQLRAFQAWALEEGPKIGLPAPNLVNGRPWPLQPRQFRRTLARHLAHRPHGLLASRVHLKHVSIAVTEGYWGPVSESAEAFWHEVEDEEKTARLKRYQQMYAARRSSPIGGGGARKLEAEFADVDAQLLAFQGTAEQSSQLLRTLLHKRSGTLHFGPLADCHFTDARQARCLRSRVDTDAPLISRCEPSRCGNAIVTFDHLPRWKDSLLQIDNHLSDRKLPKHERARLNEERARVEAVVTPLDQNE